MSYLTQVNGTIAPGFFAQSEKINDIQKSVREAELAEMIDTEGDAFILGSTQTAFQMTKCSNYVDQQSLGADKWVSLKDLYLIQSIPIVKSSINSVKLTLRNRSGNNVKITGQLINNIVTEGEEIGQYVDDFTVTVPGNVAQQQFTINFGVDHLIPDKYFVKIDRTNLDAVDVMVDSTGSYQAGLRTSADGVTWDLTSMDLTFVELYADAQCYDVEAALAIVNGDKVVPIDTHVKLPVSSAYGSRRDIVILDDYGYYEVISGDPGSKP